MTIADSLEQYEAAQPPPDRRFGASIREAVHGAYQQGAHDGERIGYCAGWRAGIGQALLGGIALGAAAMYACLAVAGGAQ